MGKGREEEDASRSVQMQLRWGQMGGGGVLAKPREGKSKKGFTQRKAHLRAIAFFS